MHTWEQAIGVAIRKYEIDNRQRIASTAGHFDTEVVKHRESTERQDMY